MIEVRESRPDELSYFCELDIEPDAREHITVSTLEQHQHQFERDDLVYLSIIARDKLAGYFMLALETDPASVEFRRVVVADKGAGIGQAAIRLMEAWCRDRLGCQRIWLDVFESNARARRVYTRLGYHLFDTGELRGRKLLYMQKNIAANPDPAAG